jgi:drug/metabolite transporter (DMT)-like permease
MNWTAISVAITFFGFWGLFLDLAVKRLNPISTQLAYSSTNLVFTLILTWVLTSMGKTVNFTVPGFAWAAAASFTGVIAGYSTVVAFENSASPGLVNAVIHTCPLVTLLLTMLFLGETLTLHADLPLVPYMSY